MTIDKAYVSDQLQKAFWIMFFTPFTMTASYFVRRLFE